MADIGLPNQRVSNSAKLKEDWFKATYEYWIAKAMASNDKTATLQNFYYANGLVSKDVFQYVIKPLSGDASLGSMPGEIRDVDFITPIKERHIGEYLELPYYFTVTVNNPDIVVARNEAVRKELTELLAQEAILMINEQKEQQAQQSQQQGAPQQAPSMPNIEARMNKVKTEWIDKRAIQGQDILKLINDTTDFEIRRLQNFYNWWATEEFYTHRWIQDGDLYVETISPLDGFPVDNGEMYVEDMDAFVVKRMITFAQFAEKYRKFVTEEERKILEKVRDNNGSTNSVNLTFITPDTYETFYSSQFNTYDDFSKRALVANPNGEVLETMICFKTEIKQLTLHYYDEQGQVQERLVEEGYKVNVEVGDIKLTTDWIPEVWTGYMFGTAGSTDEVLIAPTPDPVQRYDTKGHCKLPFGGKKGLLNGILINPIPKRLIPYLALYRIYTLQQERAIAKYKGDIEVIPKSMLQDSALSAKEQWFYRMADNTIIYDDAKISPQDVSVGFRIVGNPGLEKYIVGLNEIRRSVKEEAWELASMNDQRFGNIGISAGKGTTEQSIYRAKLGSVLMIHIFNAALEKDHQADLDYSKVAFAEGKVGVIKDANNNPRIIEIKPEQHISSSYGVYVVNSRVEEDKLNKYRELAFSAAQNGEFELAMSAIDGNSTSAIKKSISDYMTTSREFKRSIEERKTAAIEAQTALQKYEIDANNATKIEVATINASANPPIPPIDNSQQELSLKEREAARKEQEANNKLTIDQQKDATKNRDIKSKEKIASVNKN